LITKKKIARINPATLKKMGEIPVLSGNDVNRAVKRARTGLEEWSSVSLKDRARILNKFKKLIAKNRNEIIQIITDETGKTRTEATIEILDIVIHLKHLIKKGPRILSREKRSSGIFLWKKAYVTYQPHGVVGAITPWNYPLILSMEPVIQALMAGNAVVLKPSEFASGTALYLKKISLEAGIPDNAFIVITGDASTGNALVEGDTDMISFIGSTKIGQIIGEKCGRMIKPCLLELGGNDAMIIFSDAAFERAVNCAVTGVFHNSGQSCISIERILIEESIYEKFTASFKEKVNAMRAGNPDQDIDLGSISNEMQYKKFLHHISDAEKKGARITGGKIIKNASGYHVSPAIIENPKGSMIAVHEETFGPSVIIQKFKSEEEAVAIANNCEYGLGASVFTKDKKKASRVAGRLHAGNVAVNEALLFYLIGDLPLGGFKMSGNGKSHAKEGLLSYARQKSILEDRLGLKSELWWIPYSKTKVKLIDLLIKIWYG